MEWNVKTRTVQAERQKKGLATWNEAVGVVRDRADCRRLVSGPIHAEEDR